MHVINEREVLLTTNVIITLDKDSTCVIQIGESPDVKGHLGDTVRTSLGRIAVHPTWALRELFYDNPIAVSHLNIEDVANMYRHKVVVERNSTSDGIINLTLSDTSPERAADILNEMIAVYNEGTIVEKKSIIQQTSNYINERISQLDRDLGAQESQIASFKRDNQLLNIQDYGQAYMATIKEAAEEQELIKAQISHANYLKEYTKENVNKQ